MDVNKSLSKRPVCLLEIEATDNTTVPIVPDTGFASFLVALETVDDNRGNRSFEKVSSVAVGVKIVVASVTSFYEALLSGGDSFCGFNITCSTGTQFRVP
jgi:hypothetical protein